MRDTAGYVARSALLFLAYLLVSLPSTSQNHRSASVEWEGRSVEAVRVDGESFFDMNQVDFGPGGTYSAI